MPEKIFTQRASLVLLLLPLMVAFSLPAKSADVQVNYQQLLHQTAPPQLYVELKPEQLRKLSPLSKLKLNEIKKKWSECSSQAVSLFKSEKKVQAWVLSTGLGCALKIEKEAAKLLNIKNQLQLLSQNISFLDRGPWKQTLQSQWNSSLSYSWSKVKTSTQKKQLEDWAWQRPEYLTAENKRNITANKKSEATADLTSFAKTVRQLVKVETAEELADQKLQKLNSEKKEMELLSATVKFLKDFPMAQNSKKWKERSQEIWNSSLESSSLNTAEVTQVLLDSDPERLLEWAQWTFRKSYYKDSALFSEKFLKESKDVVSRGTALGVLAKSQLFLGQYEEAKRNFEILVEKYSSSDDGAEAQFRLGLLHFRLGNYSIAQRQFEKVLVSGKDRNDLQSRYWWVRCLEQQNDEKVNEEKQKIVQEFPFSYYGLKLNAELNKDHLVFEKPGSEKINPVTTKWISDHAETWSRFETLSKAGWVMEAAAELSLLPSPSESDEALSFALLQAHWGQYSSSIRLANQVYDQSSNYKNWFWAQQTFPTIYGELISTESAKYKLNPTVIRSLIRQESAYSLRAVSTSNALGLMQMIPPTAIEVSQKLKMKVSLPEDMYRPEINIKMGTFYFADLMSSFQGHIPISLASYNAGPTRIRLWLNARPETKDLYKNRSTNFRDEIWIDELPWSETSFYVKAILRNMILYKMTSNQNNELKSGFWSEFSSIESNSL